MAYFPDKTTTKTELRENVSQPDLSCVHLTTADFFELNIGYYRENTPREKWKSNQGVFARPIPMQAPVMGEAVLKLKNYFVPYRTISPQWNDFITQSPHVDYNGSIPHIVTEMPYFKATDLITLFTDTKYSTQVQSNEDFTRDDSIKHRLTKFGRHAYKILCQLGYTLVLDSKCTEHFDAMPLLAFAKVYLDYYTTNQYSQALQNAYEVEALLKKDNQLPYNLNATDLDKIFTLTQSVMYAPDYFTSQWDNPTSPNEVTTSMGIITLTDITRPSNASGTAYIEANPSTNGTPNIVMNQNDFNYLTQYAIDSLKGLTDYVKRMQISTRAIDRYLARFGVLLTSEKMNKSIYNGEQITNMQFGAIYSTAETTQANIGDYAGQGTINSDGQQHNTFEFEQLDEYGCILTLFSINPKIGYFQGIDRQHIIRDVTSYFNGQFDNLGTQATSAAELYVSMNGQSIYGKQSQFDTIFGYLPRQAHHKIGRDRLTGDFRLKSLNAGADSWHMFRIIDESKYNQTTNNMVHSPEFVNTENDLEQYRRIFNYTGEDGEDCFNIILTFNIEANIHAKPLYDSYDFEGEGKKIIMEGQGPKQN